MNEIKSILIEEVISRLLKGETIIVQNKETGKMFMFDADIRVLDLVKLGEDSNNQFYPNPTENNNSVMGGEILTTKVGNEPTTNVTEEPKQKETTKRSQYKVELTEANVRKYYIEENLSIQKVSEVTGIPVGTLNAFISKHHDLRKGGRKVKKTVKSEEKESV